MRHDGAGPGRGAKRCPRCCAEGVALPLDRFGPNRARRDGVQPYCTGCMAVATRVSHRTAGDRRRASVRDRSTRFGRRIGRACWRSSTDSGARIVGKPTRWSWSSTIWPVRRRRGPSPTWSGARTRGIGSSPRSGSVRSSARTAIVGGPRGGAGTTGCGCRISRRSSAVEHSIRNRAVEGSIPSAGSERPSGRCAAGTFCRSWVGACAALLTPRCR